MTAALPVERLHIELTGAVQGVGFRPFLYRLATEHALRGWVANTSSGLAAEVEGAAEDIARFLDRFKRERPAAAVILTLDVSRHEPAGLRGFEIRHSSESTHRGAAVMPDLAPCPECLREILDPSDRRFGYPFTSCTNCGPRYSIVLDIPYDRPNTTMRGFPLCEDCRREYTDPADRRFHAQPNACPKCGPSLASSIEEAVDTLATGGIVALKGVGGFQLLCDARSPEAVARLRDRKHREEKPLAVMMPSVDVMRRFCAVSADEEALLRSPAAPIVLLTPLAGEAIAPNVAGSSPFLGVMLPSSPLHHLLMRAYPFPVVATSGNRSEEPIAIENEEASERLAGIADRFLMHDRPIARPCDDSVVRIARGREYPIRRARGYAPLPVAVADELPRVLAVGGHLKNTVAIAIGKQVVLSQHIGDLESAEARQAFQRAIADLCRLYEFEPEMVACDLHPDYASTGWAKASGFPAIAIQHHHAHVAACAAENGVREPYLGVAWDGAGYGLDDTVWGSEFFLVRDEKFERVAHLRPFRLPGGEAAVREGWRVAASLLAETRGSECIPNSLAPDTLQRSVLLRMIARGVNAPLTTSMGRLFDAVAALAGVARQSRFEGQAAMTLEREIGSLRTTDAYPLPEGDWSTMTEAVASDAGRGVERALIAAKFHNALADWLVRVAECVGAPQIVLSGGVFQNRYLLERAVEMLEKKHYAVHTHRHVPSNDGGIALGQAVLAGRR